MSKMKIISDALENAKDFIPWQKEVNAMLDFGDDMANAGKKVIDDIGQWAKNAVISTAKMIDNNPIAKATAANGAKLTETFSPSMMTSFTKVKDTGLDNQAAFSKVWADSSLLDKAEMALMFTPAKRVNKVLSGAKDVIKAGWQLSAKQLAAAEKALNISLNKVQKWLFKQADELAKVVPVADDVAKQADEAVEVVSSKADELAESGLDFAQAGKDKLTKYGFNPSGNMSKAADDVVKTSEVPSQKMDVAKLKEQGKVSTEDQIKAIEDSITDPVKKSKFKELATKYGTSILQALKNPKVLKWLWITWAVIWAWAWAYSVMKDTNDTIKSIDNEQVKEDTSKSMSKASDTTTTPAVSNEAQDKVSLTLETTKLPNGLLPHQVISREMGLNWNKNRDEIDDGLKSMGFDLSTVGKPWSAERNIAMANYVVQLKTKHPEKFKQLQESIASNINP